MNSSLGGVKKGPDETLSIPSFHVDSSAMVNHVINTKIIQVKEHFTSELANINRSLNKIIKESKVDTDSSKNNNDRIYSINTKVMSLEERLESHFHKLSSELNSLNCRFKELENNFQKQLRTTKAEIDRLSSAYDQINKLEKTQESNFALLQNEFNNVINTRLNYLEMKLNQKIEQNGQIDLLQTRIIEANEPIIKRIVELESQLTKIHEQPYPLSMEEPPQFIVMPHQTVRNDDELIRNELFKFTQIIQGLQMDNRININLANVQHVEEVEEPIMEKVNIVEDVLKSEDISVNEIILSDTGANIPLNLPIKLMKNKKTKKK
jgi:hypothetical protein